MHQIVELFKLCQAGLSLDHPPPPSIGHGIANGAEKPVQAGGLVDLARKPQFDGIEFDRIGNFQDDRGARSRYRIDGKALVIVPDGDVEASRTVKFYAYRVKGVSLALASSDGVEMFRRIPDE